MTRFPWKPGEYNKLLEWCNMNRLTVNIKKTKHMMYSCKKKSLSLSKCINDELENVHSYKYLGVEIDDLLTYNKFADVVWNKVNNRLYNFAKIRPYLSESLACQIYKQTIMPLFEYASFILDSATKKNCNKLDKLQERAVRLIYFHKTFENGKRVFMDINELMKKYNIDHLDVRRKKQLLSLMFNLSKDETKLSVADENVVVTRSSEKVKFITEFTSITRVQISPLYRGIMLWDKLPKDIQTLGSKIDFKRAINNLEI